MQAAVQWDGRSRGDGCGGGAFRIKRIGFRADTRREAEIKMEHTGRHDLPGARQGLVAGIEEFADEEGFVGALLLAAGLI